MSVFIFLINLLLILLVLYAVANIIKWFKNREMINKLPGPPTRYFLGNMMELIGQPGEYVIVY